MLLPDDPGERLRPQRVGERRNRLRATEKVRRHRPLFAEDVGTLGRIELELGRGDLGITLELGEAQLRRLAEIVGVLPRLEALGVEAHALSLEAGLALARRG